MLTPKSIVASLNVCSKQKDLRKGIQIHYHILKKVFFRKTYILVVLWSVYMPNVARSQKHKKYSSNFQSEMLSLGVPLSWVTQTMDTV